MGNPDSSADSPVVDILLPVRNAAPTLPEALASVAAQTLGTYRVIAVDGGRRQVRKTIRALVALERPTGSIDPDRPPQDRPMHTRWPGLGAGCQFRSGGRWSAWSTGTDCRSLAGESYLCVA